MLLLQKQSIWKYEKVRFFIVHDYQYSEVSIIRYVSIQGCSHVSESGGPQTFGPFSPKNSGGALIRFYPCTAENMGGPGPPGPLDDYIPIIDNFL